MDNLIIDADKYDLFAVWIRNYCSKQKEVFRLYIERLNSMAEAWDDEETYGEVLDTVKMLGSNFDKLMDNTSMLYYRHFRERAKEIRNRP